MICDYAEIVTVAADSLLPASTSILVGQSTVFQINDTYDQVGGSPSVSGVHSPKNGPLYQKLDVVYIYK